MRIGVAAAGGDGRAALARIESLESAGMYAAWLTTGGAGPDGLSILSAAAGRTDRIKLGTSIVPTWPRHPIVAVQQTQVIASLAPGRFRLGVGPSHKPSIESMYRFDFTQPLAHLREYVHIARALLHDGSIAFDGRYYHAHARLTAPVADVPVMASALRRPSFEFCGAATDGAISWVCPSAYLQAVALPALRSGANSADRPAPPLIAHVPVALGDNVAEVRRAVREQLAGYPRLPFYAQMFADAGFPEAPKTHEWSDGMISGVVASGTEEQVGDHLRSMVEQGASELLVSIVRVGSDHERSWNRTVRFLASLSSD